MGKLDTLVAEINKQWKEDIATRGVQRIHTQKIPFTSPRLNYMTYGGLPRKRLIEFSGDENGGKTTTALDVVKNAQQLFQKEWEEELSNKDTDAKRKSYLESRGPKRVVWADCENTFDEEWAIKNGVDLDILYLLRPQTQAAEDIFEMLLNMIETDEVGLAVIDSIGVMLSKQAFEKEVGEKTYGGISMPLTRFSEVAVLDCRKYDCTVIGINQMRDDLNSPYGGKTTTGGRAWKHNCSVRLQFSKGDLLDENGNSINRSSESPKGNKVMVSIVKTKVDKPDRRTGFYTLMYDYGIDEVADLVEVGIKYGIINKSGSWFSFCDIDTGEILTDDEGKELKFQGQSKLADFLRTDEIMLDTIRDKINELM